MPNCCSVSGCYNTRRKTKGTGIRYFRFPRAKELRDKWIKSCRRIESINTDNAVVCSVHFAETDYKDDIKSRLLGIRTPQRQRTLEDFAIPSLFMPAGMNKSEAVLYYHDRAYLTGDKDPILTNNEESISKEKFQQLNKAWRIKLNNEGLRKSDLISAVDCYTSNHPEVTIKTYKSGECFSIALVTEFMKKCHTAFKEVEKLCYVETAHHNNTVTTTVTVFLAASPAGAVPLGIIFCSDGEVDSYIKGFQLLKEAIGPVAFNKKHYPETFIINDCDALKEALQETWPNSSQFLCSSRLLQHTWHTLCEPRSQIPQKDWQKLINTMKQLIHSKTTEEFTNIYTNLMSGDMSCYSKFIAHVKMLAKRKGEWCHAYQEKQMDRKLLSAICEPTAYVFKHVVMMRCKIYKTAAFVMYMSEIFSGYLQQRLLDRALEEDEKLFSKQIIDEFNFTNNGDYTFTLKSKQGDTNYNVDLNVGLCSCPTKYPHTPCDHEVACAEVASKGLPASVKRSDGLWKKITQVTFKVEDSSNHTSYIQEPEEECSKTSVKIEPFDEVVVKFEEISYDYTDDLSPSLSLENEEFLPVMDDRLEATVDPIRPSKRSRKLEKRPIQFEEMYVQEEDGDVGQIMMEDTRKCPPSISELNTDTVPLKKLNGKYISSNMPHGNQKNLPQEVITCTLLESEDESDTLEMEDLYDSDNDHEYVAVPEEELDIEEYETDSDDATPPKKRQKKDRHHKYKSWRQPPATHTVGFFSDLSAGHAITIAVSPAAPVITTVAAPEDAHATLGHHDEDSNDPAGTPDAMPPQCHGHLSQTYDVSKLILTFEETSITSSNGFKWETSPQVPATSRTSALNIDGSLMSGPTKIASKARTPEECFNLFISEYLIGEVVYWTNAKIGKLASKYKRQNSTVKYTSPSEIRALIGILIFSGSLKANHLEAKEMWSPISGTPFYRAAMSGARFSFLLSCLRFDDQTTQEERKVTDKFAPIRSVWDKFIEYCGMHYVPHENITVDEQLLAFKGNCPFRMYIPNKPAKFGIKIVMANDVKSKYLLKGIPYLGKDGTRPRDGLQLGHMFTKDLTEKYHHTNRNVTIDSWFTSIPLILDLTLNCGMTLVGKVRANKREIPDLLKNKGNRLPGSSGFLFTKDLTLVSHFPKTRTTKNVLLLSSMHKQPTVHEDGKPEIMKFYNMTKGGVDTFAQMCAQYSCSRKTKRWPLCVFYGIINAAIINAFIIHKENTIKAGGSAPKRKRFMQELALKLITPSAEERMNTPTQPRQVKLVIQQVCSINPTPTGAPGGLSAAEMREPQVRCCLCKSKANKKTRFRCHSCHQPVCMVHYYPICSNCVK